MGKPTLDNDKVLKIKNLRSLGYSLPEISRELEVPKTTVFRYIKNVQILPEFIKLWEAKRVGSRYRKILKEKQAFLDGRKVVENLSSKEKMLFACALYWGEGSKKDFGLSNTDPELIKSFINVLRNVFNIQNDRLRISIRIYEDLDRDRCLNFWSRIVAIEKEKFINVDVLHGKKKGKLEYGMCRVRVLKGGDLLKQVKGINKAFALAIA